MSITNVGRVGKVRQVHRVREMRGGLYLCFPACLLMPVALA